MKVLKCFADFDLDKELEGVLLLEPCTVVVECVNSTSLISIFQVVILTHHLLIDIHPPVMEKKSFRCSFVVVTGVNFYQFC